MIQGGAEMGARLSEDEVQRALDLDSDFQRLLSAELSRVNGEGRSIGRKPAHLG